MHSVDHGISDVPQREVIGETNAGFTPQVMAPRFPGPIPQIPEQKMSVDLSELKLGTHIAMGDTITGELTCSAGVRVSGKVIGSITCNSGAIVIDQSGVVTGSVNAKEEIFIDGAVGSNDGTGGSRVCSPGLVTLCPNAVVTADVEYGRLVTYGESTLNGTLRKISTSR